MKKILEFSMPDDAVMFNYANQGADLAFAINDFVQWLSAQEDAMHPDTVRRELFRTLRDREVSLEERS